MRRIEVIVLLLALLGSGATWPLLDAASAGQGAAARAIDRLAAAEVAALAR